jgi:hypothetical protein
LCKSPSITIFASVAFFGGKMPDTNGILSPSEKQKIADWLNNRKSLGIDCPLCYSKQWSIADHVVAPSLTNAAGVGLGAYPYFFVQLYHWFPSILQRSLFASWTRPRSLRRKTIN